MDTAFKEFSAAVKENPGLAEAHYSLGNIMAKQGKSDEAIGYYQKALSIPQIPKIKRRQKNYSLMAPAVSPWTT